MPHSEPHSLADTGTAPLRALARHWLLTILLIGAFATAGAMYGRSVPVSYTAETRLAVGAGEMSAFAIPGFPLASRELASNYARWVQNTGADPSLAIPGVDTISASPIPDSNIVRVEAEAQSPQAARTGAQTAAERLVHEVNTARSQANIDQTKAAYDELADTTGAAEARATVAAARAGATPNAANERALAQANAQAAKLRVEREAQGELYRRLVSQTSAGSDLKVVQETAVTGDDHSALIARFGLLGGAVGLVLAVLVAVLLERRRERRARRTATRQTEPTATTRQTQPVAG